eukprot:m.36412 g.36412  ORF g.36412 m.36412 type:complete len:272 (-) comp12470_c0_seq1:41-856(-)
MANSLPSLRRLSSMTRKLNQAGAASTGATTKLKRFWKKTTVVEQEDGSHAVMLDHRHLKTPMGKPFKVNSQDLANLVALEWDSQKEIIEPSSMYIASLSNTAIDHPSEMTREQRIAHLLPFFETDTISFREPVNELLMEHQALRWEPFSDWFKEHYKVDLLITQGLTDNQLPEADEVVCTELRNMNHWQLTAMELAVDTAKSMVIPLAMYHRFASAEEASLAARCEVEFQTDRFGVVEWAHSLEQADTQARLAAAALVMDLAKDEDCVPDA